MVSSLSGVQEPPLSSLFPAGQLPAGRWEAARRNLLAVQLQLDNGTALPTNGTVWLRWKVGVPLPSGGIRSSPYVPITLLVPSRW